MKITISDTAFHKKITSRYLQGKSSRFMLLTMFFLKSARGYLSRIVDMHFHLNFQIHNKYMGLSSVLLQKFHEMKVIFSRPVSEKHAPRGSLYRLNDTLILSRIQEMIAGFHGINKISVNGTTVIFKIPIFGIEDYHSKELVSFRKENDGYEKNIFNIPLIINRKSNFPKSDIIISTRKMNDHILNYSITANNSIIQERTAYSQIFNHPETTTKNFFSSDSGRTFYNPQVIKCNNYSTYTNPMNYWDSNYTQIGNNIFSYPEVLNDVNGLNYLRIKYVQSLFDGNDFTLRFNGKKSNTRTTALPDHIKETNKRNVFSRNIHFGFAARLEPKVQNGINGSNNKTASADIVFKKFQSENKITDENKLNDEKTISAKIKADKQIRNIPHQMLQGEISSIASKVYKLLERRLSIEKEKRGAHIIG